MKLGLEPWDDNLTSEYLLDKYKKKKLPIKSVLLDQNIIVGIGNIYADEILFLSKINPLKKCNLITKEEAENIIKYTKKVLEAAIEKGGVKTDLPVVRERMGCYSPDELPPATRRAPLNRVRQ